ncbi:MAG: glyoxalase [Chitinophagaceae bacterium]|nr:MAG: glyoxalase [Chitinophagaceae bacterium]
MGPKQIWANYASRDPERTKNFYTSLGFKQNGEYQAGESVSFIFGQNDFIINFFTETRLQQDVNGNLGLPANNNEIMLSLSAESKDEVDSWVDKVTQAGGTVFSDPQHYKDGYTVGFADPDGHKFNVLYWPGM